MTPDTALRRAGISPERALRIDARVVRDDGAVVLVRHGLAHQDWPPRLVDLHRRETITRAMAEAGAQLYRDYYRSGLDPTASKPDNGGSRGSGGMPGCGPRYLEYTAAVRAISPRESAERGAVIAVCVHDVGIREWARMRGNVSDRNAPRLLRVGLTRLIGHYGS